MKIGDKVYTFDSNRRVYQDDKGGHSYGPIYREHFELKEIVGETTQSWIVNYVGGKADSRACTKHKKKTENPNLFTKETMEEEIYIHDHAYYISEEVRKTSYKNLKAIAEMIGYKEVR